MPSPLDIAGFALPIVGAGLGMLFSHGDKKRAQQLEDLAMQQYGEISEPILKELQAQLVSTGDWDRLPSDFGNRNARDEAIQRLVDQGMHGGIDPQSQLAVEQGRQAGAAQEARGRASVRQEAQRRGMGGLGEYLGQMGAQQAGAQSASMADMQGAADAESRALQALTQGGTMAAQAEGQDFNRASTLARERSAIAQFNAQMGMETQQGNNAVRQQRFGNNMRLADARAGAYQRRAGQYGANADRTLGMWGGLGQGAQDSVLGAQEMTSTRRR